MSWNYQREEQSFAQVPEGKHRIRILSAEKKVSSSGNDMIELQFEVSGMNQILFHHITFLPDNPKMTNRFLTGFYDGFEGIPEGSTDMNSWIGKVGACVVKVDKNDPDRTRLSYFIKADKQGDLPPWKEPDNSASRQSGAEVTSGFTQIEANDIPF